MALRDTEMNAPDVFRCRFGRLYAEELDDDDRIVLIEWVFKRKFGAPNITKGLHEGGFSIGQDSVQRHLTSKCGCRNATDEIYGAKAHQGELDG